MKLLPMIFCILLFASANVNVVNAQDSCETDSLNNLMYSASVLGSKLLWERSVIAATSQYETYQTTDNLLMLCYAYYGQLGECLGRRDKELGESVAILGLAAAQKLSLDPANESVAFAMLAAFNGMSIAFSPMKGMMLGPKSDQQVSSSLSLDPENAIGWLQKGSSQYNTPRIFGGDVKKSIDSFKKSIDCFEADETKPTWMKIEAMIWLGQAYFEIENYQQAREIYEHILELAPGHKWVEQILLPKTLAKMDN